MNKTVIFTMDCELCWAEPNPPDPRWEPLRSDPTNGRDIYKKLLGKFREYSIPATWAFVGHLFLHSCTFESHYSSEHIENRDPHTSIEDDPLYYAPDLISMVYENKIDHEIAGHSFSHEYYTEMTEERAREDIQSLYKAAKSNGYSINSFVFPGNNNQYEYILDEFGFDIVHGETLDPGPYTFKKGIQAFIKKPREFLSIPTVTPTTYKNNIKIPSSTSFRDERWWFLQPLRIKQTLNSMDSHDVIHLNSHPHNFLDNKYLLRIFDSVLSTISNLRDKGEIDVMTMNGYATKLKE